MYAPSRETLSKASKLNSITVAFTCNRPETDKECGLIWLKRLSSQMRKEGISDEKAEKYHTTFKEFLEKHPKVERTKSIIDKISPFVLIRYKGRPLNDEKVQFLWLYL